VVLKLSAFPAESENSRFENPEGESLVQNAQIEKETRKRKVIWL